MNITSKSSTYVRFTYVRGHFYENLKEQSATLVCALHINIQI